MPGNRIYAVGDVHGHLGLLEILAEAIAEDIRDRPADTVTEIFLGDYIDRGPHSKEVIDWLMRPPAHGGERICLMGNHEQRFIDFLDGEDVFAGFCTFGGIDTTASYGVNIAPDFSNAEIGEARRALLAAMPEGQQPFLRSLPILHRQAGHIFVHAGLRPGVPLEDQSARDCLWIRDGFLDSDADFGGLVVHGHTPHETIEVRPNRINIDTGAYWTGTLTCLVIDEGGKGLIQARPTGAERFVFPG